MNTSKTRANNAGFSLLELIIVVAIIGLLAAIAIPSYTSYMQQTRRIDGTSMLTEVASEQVRFYSEYNRYTNDLTNLGYGSDAAVESNGGHYTISATIANAGNSYVLTITPTAGGAQVNDIECGSMTLNSSGQKTVTGSSTAANCW